MLAYGETIGTIIYIVALLATAALLLTQKKPKLANLDDALQSVATQGAFIPLVIGRQRVGPVFAWVEDATAGVAALAPQSRSLLPSFSSLVGTQGNFGKGGGGAPTPPSYFENALHLLCIGPGSQLRAIYQNGELIWSGAIDPLSHPSGSMLPAGDSSGSEGWFEIHWGFPDDPILTPLQNSQSHGLGVRYSHVMKILWLPKNLGQSRQWPRLEYEVVCPCYSQITTTPSEVPLEGDDQHPTFRELIQPDNIADLFAVNQGAVDGTQRMEFWIGGKTNSFKREIIIRERDNPSNQEDLTPWFPSGSIVKLRTQDNLFLLNGGALAPGTPLPPPPFLFGHDLTWCLPNNGEWRYFWIIKSYRSGLTTTSTNLHTILQLGPEVDPEQLKNIDNSPPYLDNVTTSPAAVDARFGNARPVSIANSDGINPIHMADQLLFAKYPYGSAKDRSAFDARSIEVASQIMQAEKIRGGLTIRDGEGAKSALASIQQDCGLMIVWDVQVGQFVFNMIRYLESAVDLPEEMILENPESTAVQGARPADVLAFTFKDRERNYREVPVRVTDSGQVAEQETQRSKKIPIEVTNDRDSVTRLAPRRQQEVMSNLVATKFTTNHGTILATPGQRFLATDTEGPGLQFLLTEVQRDINSSKVELGAILDCLNPPLTSPQSLTDRVLTPKGTPFVDQVEAFAAFELPRAVSGGEVQVLFVASRSSEKTVSALVWGSRDGSQYSILGNAVLCISGILRDGLGESECFDENTYEVDFGHNVDANLVQDLSLDLDSWRAGKQIMLIGNEVIFLKNGGIGHPDTIEGLIRGRAGTRMQDHLEGTRFWILPASYVLPIQNTMIVPGKDLTFKVQASTKNRTSDLAEIDGQTIAVQGLAFLPPQPTAVRQENLLSTYPIGATNVDLTWCYYSDEFKRTGLGTQPLGAACGQSPPRGYFLVDLNGLETIKVETNAISIPLASRAVLDTLPSWTVTIIHVEGSFSSDPATLTLTPV